MRRETTQIHPVEASGGLIENRRAAGGRTVSRSEGIIGALGCGVGNMAGVGGAKTRDIDGHHVFGGVAPTIRAEKNRRRLRVGRQLRTHIAAGQHGEPHPARLVIHRRRLAARHGEFAGIHQHHPRVRLGQHGVDQMVLAATIHLIVDIALRQRQKRQRLGQSQWGETHRSVPSKALESVRSDSRVLTRDTSATNARANWSGCSMAEK